MFSTFYYGSVLITFYTVCYLKGCNIQNIRQNTIISPSINCCLFINPNFFPVSSHFMFFGSFLFFNFYFLKCLLFPHADDMLSFNKGHKINILPIGWEKSSAKIDHTCLSPTPPVMGSTEVMRYIAQVHISILLACLQWYVNKWMHCLKNRKIMCETQSFISSPVYFIVKNFMKHFGKYSAFAWLGYLFLIEKYSDTII